MNKSRMLIQQELPDYFYSMWIYRSTTQRSHDASFTPPNPLNGPAYLLGL